MPLMGLGWAGRVQGGLAAALRSRRFADLGTKQTATISVKLPFGGTGCCIMFVDYYVASDYSTSGSSAL